MKKVLVTGGAGFIGSNLVDALIKRGVEVVIIDNLSTGKLGNINKNALFLKHDLCSLTSKDFIKILDGVDTIFHLAALARVQPSINDPIPYNDANVNATLSVLYAAHKAGINRVV